MAKGAQMIRPGPAEVRSQRRGTNEEVLEVGTGQTDGDPPATETLLVPAADGCRSELPPRLPILSSTAPYPECTRGQAKLGHHGQSSGCGLEDLGLQASSVLSHLRGQKRQGQYQGHTLVGPYTKTPE